MTTALTKMVCLMERDLRTDSESVEFVARDEETGERTRGVSLSVEDFHLLGEPRQLTVTIEPGDKLNPAA